MVRMKHFQHKVLLKSNCSMNFLMTSIFITPGFPNYLMILKLICITKGCFVFLGEKIKNCRRKRVSVDMNKGK